MDCQDYVRVAEFLGFIKGMCAAFIAIGLGAVSGFFIARKKRK